jgi:A/G-specific adenine glycosylase
MSRETTPRAAAGNPDINNKRKLGAGNSHEPKITQDWIKLVHQELISWYEASHRQLPWRKRNDPYEILISEMMLVQTTVAAVIPFFERFLRQFPNPQVLAEATEADVLKAWEGLGYYRRARQLQAAARIIVEQYGGQIPRGTRELRALPGVGRYMAGAILSFAFDLPEPIIEANSQRVLARLLAWPENIKSSASQQWLWKVAGCLVPRQGAGKFNQALMDLGALICTPRRPSCLICPLVACCEARRLGIQDVLPLSPSRVKPLAVVEACAVVVQDESVLIVQRKEGGLWSKFWEFPTINLDGANPAGRSFERSVDLVEGIKRLTGVEARVGPEIHRLTYAVTKHRVQLRVHIAKPVSGELKPGSGLIDARFMAPDTLNELPLGSATRKVVNWIGQDAGRLASFWTDHHGRSH